MLRYVQEDVETETEGTDEGLRQAGEAPEGDEVIGQVNQAGGEWHANVGRLSWCRLILGVIMIQMDTQLHT